MKRIYMIALWLIIISAPVVLSQRRNRPKSKDSTSQAKPASKTSKVSNLTRSSAAQLIRKDARFPEDKNHLFDMINTKGTSSYNKMDRGFQILSPAFSRAMESLGYLDSGSELTEKGKTLIADLRVVHELRQTLYSSRRYSVPIGKRELIEVIGISEGNPMGAFKEATFKWHWKPVNDIGKAMNLEKETYTGSATFQKFDDGWRVQRIDLVK